MHGPLVGNQNFDFRSIDSSAAYVYGGDCSSSADDVRSVAEGLCAVDRSVESAGMFAYGAGDPSLSVDGKDGGIARTHPPVAPLNVAYGSPMFPDARQIEMDTIIRKRDGVGTSAAISYDADYDAVPGPGEAEPQGFRAVGPQQSHQFDPTGRDDRKYGYGARSDDSTPLHSNESQRPREEQRHHISQHPYEKSFALADRLNGVDATPPNRDGRRREYRSGYGPAAQRNPASFRGWGDNMDSHYADRDDSLRRDEMEYRAMPGFDKKAMEDTYGRESEERYDGRRRRRPPYSGHDAPDNVRLNSSNGHRSPSFVSRRYQQGCEPKYGRSSEDTNDFSGRYEDRRCSPLHEEGVYDERHRSLSSPQTVGQRTSNDIDRGTRYGRSGISAGRPVPDQKIKGDYAGGAARRYHRQDSFESESIDNQYSNDGSERGYDNSRAAYRQRPPSPSEVDSVAPHNGLKRSPHSAIFRGVESVGPCHCRGEGCCRCYDSAYAYERRSPPVTAMHRRPSPSPNPSESGKAREVYRQGQPSSHYRNRVSDERFVDSFRYTDESYENTRPHYFEPSRSNGAPLSHEDSRRYEQSSSSRYQSEPYYSDVQKPQSHRLGHHDTTIPAPSSPLRHKLSKAEQTRRYNDDDEEDYRDSPPPRSCFRSSPNQIGARRDYSSQQISHIHHHRGEAGQYKPPLHDSFCHDRQERPQYREVDRSYEEQYRTGVKQNRNYSVPSDLESPARSHRNLTDLDDMISVGGETDENTDPSLDALTGTFEDEIATIEQVTASTGEEMYPSVAATVPPRREGTAHRNISQRPPRTPSIKAPTLAAYGGGGTNTSRTPQVSFSPSTELPPSEEDEPISFLTPVTSSFSASPARKSSTSATLGSSASVQRSIDGKSVYPSRTALRSGRVNSAAEAERLAVESEARQQIMKEIWQAQDMRDSAGDEADRKFWERQIDALNGSLRRLATSAGGGGMGEGPATSTSASDVVMKKSPGVVGSPGATVCSSIYEAIPSSTPTVATTLPVSKDQTVKVRAPADLPAGHRFVAKFGGRSVIAVVPPGGVSKGDVFTVRIPKGGGPPTTASAEKKQPKSILKQKIIKVRSPAVLPEGHRFTVKVGDNMIVATVPKGGVEKGEIINVPVN